MADPRRKQHDVISEQLTDDNKIAKFREEAPGQIREEPAQARNTEGTEAQRAATSSQESKPRSKRLRRILLLLGPLLMVVGGLYFYLSGGRYVSTDNAYVRADKLNVATDVSGIVAEIAVTENQKRIAAARDAERSSGQAAPVAQTRTDPRLESALAEITRPLEGFQFYADYVNPFTVYLDGLYFLHAGAGASDLERASKSLRRVAEVADARTAIDADLRLADAGGVPGRASTGGLAYVILETGRGASLEQVRIDIPIIFADVSYVGAAFPKLVFHGDYTPELSVRTGTRELATGRVADLDAVIALDFKKEFFTNAPTGQIFATTAANLKPQYLGKKNGPTRVAVENVINRVQQGQLKSADAWAEAVKEAEKASKS